MSFYANGLAVSGKAKKGKSSACFPDPCWSPPSPGAGWIVIPYANTAYAKDTANGSKTVFVEGKPAMLKDKSYFKTSTGNEAADGPKGFTTGNDIGKAYFTSWSMDVKIEGYNVCRHLDMMTHNHGSTGNTTFWHYSDDKVGKKPPRECFEDCVDIEKACGDFKDCKNCKQSEAEQRCGGKPSGRDTTRRQIQNQGRRKESALIKIIEKALKGKGINFKLMGTWKTQHCAPCAMIKPMYAKDGSNGVQAQIDCLKKQKDRITNTLENLDQLIDKGVSWDDLPGLAKELGLDYLQDGSIFIPTPTKILKAAGCLMSSGGLCADLIELSSIPSAVADKLKEVSGQVTSFLDNMDETINQAEDLKSLSPKNIAKIQELCVKEQKCLSKRKCILEPFEKSNGIGSMLDNEGCCPGQTAHHLIPNSMYQQAGERGNQTANVAGCSKYDTKKAPNVCVEGASQALGSHKKIHVKTKKQLDSILTNDNAIMTYNDAKKAAVEAHSRTFPGADCSKKCIEKQLDNYRDKSCGKGSNPRLRKVDGSSSKQYIEPEDNCPI